ncbi:hypothetical protein BKA82DRAFT_542243 [Pisolithus tinctorius]|uniref:Uncharacterized protein n=1 Tax=Pisolithus tinctorius Marx 270 TaxID=870435 RepID=A0A0C3J7C1_PISTI|nr:hypothetical protein BKA82DRAFT_542243 [Pisolithus tinctorius]KIO04938.1 hypothetical protein M404DRAFT_542243 [Pisolithus tinctorius Marx 270]
MGGGAVDARSCGLPVLHCLMLPTPTMNLSTLGTLFGTCWLPTSEASEFPYLKFVVRIDNRQSSSRAEEQPRADIADLETKASRYHCAKHVAG